MPFWRWRDTAVGLFREVSLYYNMQDSKKQHRVREYHHMKRQYYEPLGDEDHFQNIPSVATENRR